MKVEQDCCSFLHSLCYALKHRHAFVFSFLVKVSLYQKAICYVDNHMHINVCAYTKNCQSITGILLYYNVKDPQSSTKHVENTLEPDRAVHVEEFALKDAARDKRLAPAPLARDQAPLSTPNQKANARDETRDSSPLARHETTAVTLSKKVPRDQVALSHDEALPGNEAHAVDKKLAGGLERDSSTLARDQSESDSDDGAVVIGRSARTGNRDKEKAYLNSDASVESNQRTLAVNKRDVIAEKTKAYRGKKHAAEETTKSETGDSNEKNSKTEGMFNQWKIAA